MKLYSKTKSLFFFLTVLIGLSSLAQSISVHDPVMIKEKDTYYLFCTGKGIKCLSSTDLKNWKSEPVVFPEKPIWTDKVVPEFGNHIWAPDIIFHNNQYYLYYSISAFGKNTSAIGVATNSTLNVNDANYKWVDHGIVVQSYPNRDEWNAIDPNVIIDENNTPWLSFGSFWDGIKMVKLNSDLLSIAQPQEWYSVANRKNTVHSGETSAIEAPFIFKKNGYYYLFTSWDLCCKGKESTYKIAVGRSKTVTGPYKDKEGKLLSQGGGSILVKGDQDYYGVGHNSAYTFDGVDYLVFHGYNAMENGKSTLLIKEMKWDSDFWPYL
ncbi:arabinan endo-1,5-alpha-L-arabinosidase [Flavobacterium sp. L1I52]|uniref:Arabinan endo-1,5-alpha-L-arabinosidase n=1 Tax=Flavobacterium pokkalii TaxID=1940408 RepID=A0ABR7USB3_9FLAO|nr:arabinan endo-1,5-alpha-L-arabinosidase [Flavobacterium pokkalii]MBD0725301.1 arabinan endo-1,5-alpha-L-arabinosidase [Flavobacterium pokkalii]